MYQSKPIFTESSPVLKLILLIIIIVVSLLITAFVGVLIGLPFYGSTILETLQGGSDLTNPEQISLLKYLQIINQLGMFIIPPVLFAFLVNRNISDYLKLNRKPYFFTWLAGGVLILFALPLLHWIGELNEMIKFPESLSSIEEWLIRSEEKAQELTEVFINVKTYPALMINVLMIAVLPAIGEELLFRGVLLRVFREWFKNTAIAVVVSAILFSALHFQFYGFIPRFLLGVFLGYLFVWSGSLWVPIIVHFINNAMAVIVIFYINRNGTETPLEDIGSSSSSYVIILSTLLVVVLTSFIITYEKRKQR